MKNMNIMEKSIIGSDKTVQNKKTKPVTGPEVFQNLLEKGKNGKLSMEEFVKKGIYAKEEVALDEEEIKQFRLSDNFERPTTASIVSEFVVSQIGEEMNWFSNLETGTKCYCTRLSEHDDISFKSARADILLELKMPEGETAELLLDVTTDFSPAKLQEKKGKCEKTIRKGRLHPIKYFKSKLTEKMGRKVDLPMVIVGFNKDNLLGFCERFSKDDNLENDHLAFMLLDEIVGQLSYYFSQSEIINGSNHYITQKLKRTLEIFINILNKKESLRPQDFREKASSDDVYAYLA